MNPRLNKYFDKSALVLLGQIAALKGTKGDVVLQTESLDYEINESEPVLVETDGYLVPFFIEENSVVYSKNGDISLKFDTTDSAASAARLVGKKVYVLKEDLIETEDGEDFEPDFKYLNYSCYDQNGTLLGVIEDVDDIPGNPLLVIRDSFGKEILAPVNAAEILEENDIIQTVKITIPDGLLDL